MSTERKYRVEFTIYTDTREVTDNCRWIAENIKRVVEQSGKVEIGGDVIVEPREIIDENHPEFGNRDLHNESRLHKMFPTEGDRATYREKPCVVGKYKDKTWVRVDFLDRTSELVRYQDLVPYEVASVS